MAKALTGDQTCIVDRQGDFQGSDADICLDCLKARRLDVEFQSGADLCRAWLYLPGCSASPPVIVMGHGLGGTRDMRLDLFAERFQEAGYACLVFDYRHFGASGGFPRQLLDVRRQLQDWAAAVAFARCLPVVDGSRLVLWGTSFAGGHVVSVAAHDNQISAVVSQNPFADGLASALAVPLGTSVKLTIRALRDIFGSWFGSSPVMVPVAGKPGDTALMTAPDVWGGHRKMHAEDRPERNWVAARIGLKILLYRPGRQIGKVGCPILFCICEDDSVAPASTALGYARRAGRAEIWLSKAGHFDIYFDEEFERAVSAQIAFLSRHVPTENLAKAQNYGE